MAKQTIVMLTDDLDGGEAAETVTFALDGVGYEIDLSNSNAKKLRDFMEAFIESGTRTGRVGSGAQLGRPRSTPVSGATHPTFMQNKELNTKIRKWASTNGYHLAERGRIPQHIVDAYHDGRANPQQKLPADEALAAEQVAENDKRPPAKSKRGSVPAASFKPEKVSA